MALTNDQTLILARSTDFRSLAALAYTKAYQEIHRGFPVLVENPSTEDKQNYNKQLEYWRDAVSTKSEIERSISPNGSISAFGALNLIAAFSGYAGFSYEGNDPNGLVEAVMTYKEGSENIVLKECVKLIKGMKLSFQTVEIAED